MIVIESDIFGNQIKSEKLTATQLSLFSANDELTMAQARAYQTPINEITDRLVAAMIGKKYVTALGLAFSTALTESEVFLGLTTLKLSGKVTVSVTKKKIEEELYSLA
jgi:hypothetical protein